MIYRRRRYTVRPDQVEAFNEFFHKYLLPNQLKHGATLVGRWVNESQTEIMALWEYESYEVYQKIQAQVQADPLHIQAQARRRELGSDALFLAAEEEFLSPTGQYQEPKHRVAAAGLITNDRGEVLLVRSYHRSDTWEIPGGVVETGESPDVAVVREIEEETGIQARICGVTGVQYNMTRGILTLTYRGVAVGGELRTSDETAEVKFVPLTPENAHEYITRPHFLQRVLDALRGPVVPSETYSVRPYRLINRISAD